MANDAGHAGTDLADLSDSNATMDFFELLLQLERDGHQFGRAGQPGSEPARLGQTARMAFATSDVAAVIPHPAGGPPDVAVNVLGLLGPEGPMPLHLTRWVMERLSNRWFAGDTVGATADASFLDFVNMLQHRMIALYWRSWADAQLHVQAGRGDQGRVAIMLQAIAGMGLPGTKTGDPKLDNAKLRHATSLTQQTDTPDRLAGFLETVLELPVSVVEYVGIWREIPEHLQSRLGGNYSGLGTGAVAGARVFDRQSRAELHIGPLSGAEFTMLLEDQESWARLRHALAFAKGRNIDYGVRLLIAAGQVPHAHLGMTQLGRTAWLHPDPNAGADDLCFSNIDMNGFDAGPSREVA